MADHARAIGDRCFKEEQFVAAVHCYEVATLLCPSGWGTLPSVATGVSMAMGESWMVYFMEIL